MAQNAQKHRPLSLPVKTAPVIAPVIERMTHGLPLMILPHPLSRTALMQKKWQDSTSRMSTLAESAERRSGSPKSAGRADCPPCHALWIWVFDTGRPGGPHKAWRSFCPGAQKRAAACCTAALGTGIDDGNNGKRLLEPCDNHVCHFLAAHQHAAEDGAHARRA